MHELEQNPKEWEEVLIFAMRIIGPNALIMREGTRNSSIAAMGTHVPIHTHPATERNVDLLYLPSAEDIAPMKRYSLGKTEVIAGRDDNTILTVIRNKPKTKYITDKKLIRIAESSVKKSIPTMPENSHDQQRDIARFKPEVEKDFEKELASKGIAMQVLPKNEPLPVSLPVINKKRKRLRKKYISVDKDQLL